MSATWVAGSVRARAIARRRLGTAGVHALAACESPTAAIQLLVHSPYGHSVRSGDSLVTAGRGVATTLLWNLRVLAGWQPVSGAQTLRLLAGWFEIANVDGHVRGLAGRSAEAPFRLGTLATAWPRIAVAASIEDIRASLASSPWGDPEGDTPRDIDLSMRLGWAHRVAAGIASQVRSAQSWAHGAAALLMAREIARGLPLPPRGATIAARLLGPACVGATSLDELRASLPATARWPLDQVSDPADLWRAEISWWRRVRTDGAGLLAVAGFGPRRTVGAAAVLAHDAWQVRGALAAVARGGAAAEEFHALA